jgi:hypothetical protein
MSAGKKKTLKAFDYVFRVIYSSSDTTHYNESDPACHIKPSYERIKLAGNHGCSRARPIDRGGAMAFVCAELHFGSPLKFRETKHKANRYPFYTIHHFV